MAGRTKIVVKESERLTQEEDFETDPRVMEAENPTLAKAKLRSASGKKDKLYPPKMRKFSNMVYTGRDMTEFFPDRVLKHGDFKDADLSGADFTGFNLQGSVFSGTNLENTCFVGADLRWCKFANCVNSKTADFTGADLTESTGI